jgi:transposase
MKELPVLDARAAFCDVGSEHMHVSIAGGPPKVFGTVTSQLHELRDWLLSEDANSVAMEATGVYWLALYSVLEDAGFEVVMVNGRQTRNLPGRKTDMLDCQWGATLHAHGLLKPGFVPPAHIRKLQDYQRLRTDHISLAASHVQHMQKALERMNIKLHTVISSLTGVSGLAVVRAILNGQRDPAKLLELCHSQIRDKKAREVTESLRGTWAPEHLFALKQAVQSWDHYQEQIAECDRQIQILLQDLTFDDTPDAGMGKESKTHAGKGRSVNAPPIPGLHNMLVELCQGQDLTVLPAHTDYSVLQIVSEVGTDLSKWPTDKHFTSWMGLAPGTHQSGKRHANVKRSRNRVGRLFCVMARSLARSKDIALGGFYRRLSARRGGLVANIALARKLAAMFWRVRVKGLDFVEHGLAAYEAKMQEAKQRTLRRLAKELGQTVSPMHQAA